MMTHSEAHEGIKHSARSCAELRQKHTGWEPLALATASPSSTLSSSLSSSSAVCSETLHMPGGARCAGAKVWIAARRQCEKAGSRLCTSTEVLAGAARRMSCLGDERPPEDERPTVWTSTRCGRDTTFLIEYANGEPGARIGNATKWSAGGIKNCDDSSYKHRVVCCADGSHG